MSFGGFLASAKVHRRGNIFSHFILFGFVALVVAGLVSFFAATQAQGYGEVDSSTIGVGASQSSAEATALNASERLGVSAGQGQDDEGISEELAPSDSAERSITVKDPDPVINLVAIDRSNPEAIEKAREVCTVDPLPTAPRLTPDVNDGTWSSGVASAYSVASNDDGHGNFGVSTTASGRALNAGSVTVAVPASQSYLLGRVVEICYEGRVVIATVTDTGGFGKYGRALDLAPGVFNALGAATPIDWGTRTIYYRFL